MQRKRRTLEHPAQSVENRTEQPRPKTKPAKPRKRARIVLSGGGTHQRPMPPSVARFADKIKKAFFRHVAGLNQHLTTENRP